MKVLVSDVLPARPERAATRLLHDEPNTRVVEFHLLPGQHIPAHSSDSTVLVHVVEGAGTFIGRDGEALLGVGKTAVYAPGEEHAITAESVPLRFLALITPRPAG